MDEDDINNPNPTVTARVRHMDGATDGAGSVWKELRLRHLEALKNVLAPRHIWSELLEEELITPDEFNLLRCDKSPRDEAALLLQKILPAKGDRAYDRFRKVLQESEKLAWIAEHYMPPRNPEKLPSPRAGEPLVERGMRSHQAIVTFSRVKVVSFERFPLRRGERLHRKRGLSGNISSYDDSFGPYCRCEGVSRRQAPV